MSRQRLLILLVVSVFATTAVLAGAHRRGPSKATVAAALRTAAAVRTAPVAATATVAPTLASADPVISSSGSSAASSSNLGDGVTGTAAAPAAAAAAATPEATATATPTPAAPKPSKVKHVFVVALRGAGYEQDFGADSPMPYLSKELRPQGALLSGFAPIDAADLPNRIAFAGGQPPNADTQAGCADFSDFPASATADKKGVLSADGCNYPNTVISLGDQVSASGSTWRAYSENQGDRACRLPTTPDADGFAARHNPFVFFRSVVDIGDCPTAVVDLSRFDDDYKTAKASPAFSFIAPDTCHDGTDATCADGTPGGPAATDAWLREWVPKITATPAYKRDGALVIAFLSSGATDPTGALVLSSYAQPGSEYARPTNPYGLLRSVQELLGLKTLAKSATARSFVKAVFPTAFGGPDDAR